MTTNKISVLLIAFLVLIVASPTPAEASNAWGNYHWARMANPFTLKLGDNLSTNWDAYLIGASNDWSLSSVLNTQVIPGITNPKNCRATSGRVEICNSKYGNNGWLGIASVWASGEHITQGTVKLNDSYFSTAKYNTPAWKNMVMCQEIGHVFGLDHQDEKFDNPNLGTCMDYTNDPSANQRPNLHDYDILESIYSHLDSGTTVSQTPFSNRQDVDHADPSTWGKQIRTSVSGNGSLYVHDLGAGNKLFTFVIWAN